IPPARCPELPACHPRRDAVEPYRLRRADALISVGARIRITELIFNFWLSCEFSRTTAVVKGFRMPASHGARGCMEAGVRKASKEETAGEYAPAVSVYGDLRRGCARLGRSRRELPA